MDGFGYNVVNMIHVKMVASDRHGLERDIRQGSHDDRSNCVLVFNVVILDIFMMRFLRRSILSFVHLINFIDWIFYNAVNSERRSNNIINGFL